MDESVAPMNKAESPSRISGRAALGGVSSFFAARNTVDTRNRPHSEDGLIVTRQCAIFDYEFRAWALGETA